MTAMPRTPPQAILLATDLSARCDRARDRALQLARQWNARLVALTVAPAGQDNDLRDATLGVPAWARTGPALEAAARALQRDFAGAGVDVRTLVESGDPAGAAILRVAREQDCDLIVTGIASNQAFQPPVLGSTIAWLSRHADRPVLVVHARPHGGYRRLAIASDLSPTSRHALETALACFPDAADVALVHAGGAPRKGLVDGDREAAAARTREDAQARVRAHLAEAGLADAVRARIDTVVEDIDPARLVDLHLRSRDADLLVLGSHGRSALFEILIGSVAQRLLETVRTDTLIVRAPNARGRGRPGAAGTVHPTPP